MHTLIPCVCICCICMYLYGMALQGIFCMYVCMYTQAQAQTQKYYIRTRTDTYIHTQVHAYTHFHTITSSTHAYINNTPGFLYSVVKNMCICICMYVHTCACLSHVRSFSHTHSLYSAAGEHILFRDSDRTVNIRLEFLQPQSRRSSLFLLWRCDCSVPCALAQYGRIYESKRADTCGRTKNMHSSAYTHAYKCALHIHTQAHAHVQTQLLRRYACACP